MPRTFKKWVSACANCDRIRGPEGWYIPALGELESTQQTHDICPDCIRMLYPAYARVADQLILGNPISTTLRIKQKTQTP